MRNDVRIATVYRPEHLDALEATDMSEIRWLRISEALARLGYRVDMIANLPGGVVERAPRLRQVPYAEVRWSDYDVVKTLFHKGFDALAAAGGDEHPFIISKLGSVVGSTDDLPGVHFRGAARAALFETQRRIAARSRFVTLLTTASRRLWEQELGHPERCLLVPTGVDAELPAPGPHPFPDIGEPVALYLGNIYGEAQRDVNLVWQSRLNVVGSALSERGIRLCFVGTGLTDRLDPEAVTTLGATSNVRSWDYQRAARVGIALAQGPVQDNESSKLYYYLRTGLPVVAEAPIPNAGLVTDAGCGFVVPYDDPATMAAKIAAAVGTSWDREATIRWMLDRHTWDHRAAVYDTVIRRVLGRGP